MSETLKVKLDIKNPETKSFLIEAVSAVPGFTISSNGAPCDVIVMEIGADPSEEFRFVEQIKAKGLAKEVFLTSARQDSEMLLKALKTGVKEFFPQPINKAEVMVSLAKLRKSTEAAGMQKATEKKGRLISVIGSKGGVGATTVAVNLAVSVKEMASEKSVVLMDMNPFLGGVQLFLNIKTSFSWVEGARDIARMDSTYLLNTLYKHSTGIHVLPAPSSPVGLETATPETMERLVGLLRSAFDIIIIDGCRSFDDLSLRMLALSDTILVVSELNFPSLVNAKKLLDTFDGLGLSYGKDIKAVINRYQKKTTVSSGEAEKTLGRKIVSMIPNDYETTMSAINTGKTLSDVAWKSAVMENVRELAALLLHKEAPRKEKSLFTLNPFASWGKSSTD
jgi:pilus assembly protein CpaE